MGVPAHDERDFAFARKYHLRIKPVIAVDGQTYSIAAGKTGTPTSSAAAASTPGARRHGLSGRGEQGRRPAARARAWARRRPPGACATGASAASATGARRSRSFIAPPAATCRCPSRTCPSCCPKTWCPTAAATRCARTRVPERCVPEVRRTVAARDRHDGHLRRFGVVLHALCLPGRNDGDGRCAQRLLDADGPVHRRHRARRAAPACTRASGPRRCATWTGQVRRAVHQAVHAGHAAQRELLPRRRRRQEAAGTSPSEVNVQHDERGTPIGATAKEDGLP